MQIIIEIPKGIYEKFLSGNYPKFYACDVADILRKGTLLPEGHGKIIDADKIEWYGCMSEEYCPHKNTECKDCIRAECDKRQVDAITAIVEADGGVE